MGMTTRFSPNLNNDPWPMNFWWADFIRRDEDKDGLPFITVTPFKLKTLLPKPKEGHFSRLLDGSNKANLGIFPSKENKTETLLKILKETFLPKVFIFP